MNHCKNCIICVKIAEIGINSNKKLKAVLGNVEQWDILIQNQYKSINNYICLVCDFKTSDFNTWKFHIMSLFHMNSCHKLKDLYSYVCSSKGCKVVIYGPENSISNHRQQTHLESGIIPVGVPCLMAEVMKRFDTDSKPLYFCSHCKKFKDTPIHSTKNELNNVIKNIVEHYCKFCQVHFLSSPEMVDYHSLSVEHTTLKCFYMLCTKDEKINLNVFKQIDQKKISTSLNLVTPSNSIKLPNVVINRFKHICDNFGKCKLCDTQVNWNSKSFLAHLNLCKYECDISGSNNTAIKTFECKLCSYTSSTFTKYKTHIISPSHFTNICNTIDCFSYFCNICSIIIYGHKTDINNHRQLHFKDSTTMGLPVLSNFMANIFAYFNTNPIKIDFKHYNDDDIPDLFEKEVSFRCDTCKIEFHSSKNAYNMHELTSEHIILKYLNPKISSVNQNSSKTTTVPTNKKQVEKKTAFHFDFVKNADNDELLEVIVSKNPAHFDDNHSKLSDNIQKAQDFTNKKKDKTEVNEVLKVQKEEQLEKIPFSNVNCLKQSSNNVKDCNTELANSEIELESSNVKKKKYTQYLMNKIDTLKYLQQHMDDLLSTSFYYCNACDYITEEKNDWYKHNQTKHNCNKLAVYCSTCSIYFASEKTEEHCNTIEHKKMLQLVESLIQAKKISIKKMCRTLNDSNHRCDEQSLNIEKNKKSELNSISKNKDLYSDQYFSKAHQNNTDDLDKELIKNKILTKNLSVENYEKIGYESNNGALGAENKIIFNETIQPNEESSISNETALFSKSLTNITKYFEKVGESDDDKSYGDYVIQRLKAVKDDFVKQDIKLEIDYVFCRKLFS